MISYSNFDNYYFKTTHSLSRHKKIKFEIRAELNILLLYSRLDIIVGNK